MPVPDAPLGRSSIAEAGGASGLRRALGGFQYLTIAIGCMIGIGWITVVGQWLSRAGPAGTLIGFAAGGVVMAGVAACYAELTGMMPSSGGDVIFAERVFGRDVSFFVGWFLVLMAVSVASFEALSFVWVAGTLAPWLGSTPLYSALGETVTAQQIALGFGALGFMYTLNLVGVNASARAQDLLTVFKLLVMIVFVGVAILLGDPSRVLRQALTVAPGHESWISGSLWVAATCAFWLGGFQVISQAAEERSPQTSLRLIGVITASSVAIGLLFYLGVVVAVTAAAPLDKVVSAHLPAAYAAQAAFGSRWGAAAVLLAGMCGIMATLNAMLLSGSRLSLALARSGFLPGAFGRIAPRGAPVVALSAVTLLAGAGVLAGKGLLVPVVDTASMSLIVSYALVCAAVLRLRRTSPATARPFRVPGGVWTVRITAFSVALMAVYILIEPALERRSFPVEWSISLAWVALGVIVWSARRRAPPLPGSLQT